MKKTQWLKTGDGFYVQIFSPEWEGFHEIEPPTEEEQIVASMNYIIARYREAILAHLSVVVDYMATLIETFEILADPETMEAIREADDEAVSRWEGEGGALGDEYV